MSSDISMFRDWLLAIAGLFLGGSEVGSGGSGRRRGEREEGGGRGGREKERGRGRGEMREGKR